eukprot:TRINITY_DN21896_c0_g1_i1.p1 TRINITY_DN21896_c0_g1~~TRINITY_DN21896_c0_g1_i1.p1  ORF type:complete len:325 (+),score=94.58 TRINITY_DN21896_c0_g1_i1:52-975(+)
MDGAVGAFLLAALLEALALLWGLLLRMRSGSPPPPRSRSASVVPQRREAEAVSWVRSAAPDPVDDPRRSTFRFREAVLQAADLAHFGDVAEGFDDFLRPGVHDVPGDGDCQFHALVAGMVLLGRQHRSTCVLAGPGTPPAGCRLWHQLRGALDDASGGAPERLGQLAKELRRASVSHVYANADPAVLAGSGFSAAARADWLGSAGRGVWGNDVTLTSAAAVLGVAVHVVKISLDECGMARAVVMEANKNSHLCPNGVVHLLLRDEHYQYLSATSRGSQLRCPVCVPAVDPQRKVFSCFTCNQRIAPR